jgi:exopolysaccharide biosynthesis polyprenyl glycosylphosphotransferase
MKRTFYKTLLRICDFLVVVFSFLFVLLWKNGEVSIYKQLYLQDPIWGITVGAYLLSVILVFQNYHLYKIDVVLSKSRQFVQIVISFFYLIIGFSVISFFFQFSATIDSPIFVVRFACVGVTVVSVYRILLFRPIYILLNRHNILKTRLVVVGVNTQSKNFIIQCSLDNIYGIDIIGFIDDVYKKGTIVFKDLKNLGSIREVQKIVDENRVEEILITVNNVSLDRLLKIIDICKKTKALVRVNSPLFDIVYSKKLSERYFNIPLARFSNDTNSTGQEIVKRIFDIAWASIGMLLFLIPFAVIAVLIKATSQGPILFKQIRIGKNGRPFTFYKFRSMSIGSEHDVEREKMMHAFIREGKNPIDKNGSVKVVNEENVTSVGMFLRKTSIDEFPQLFNVLKGDMSLVGPRPCLPYEYQAYDEWHKRRLNVMPGCTGLWQVEARSTSSFEEMVLLDLYYIENKSFWLDLQLIIKTIPVMLFQKGGK